MVRIQSGSISRNLCEAPRSVSVTYVLCIIPAVNHTSNFTFTESDKCTVAQTTSYIHFWYHQYQHNQIIVLINRGETLVWNMQKRVCEISSVVTLLYLLWLMKVFLHNTAWSTICECLIMQQLPLHTTSENIPDLCLNDGGGRKETDRETDDTETDENIYLHFLFGIQTDSSIAHN